MKLTEDFSPVQRSRSLRSQPYDLRRRVLVNNFMKDQHPSELIANRPPTPRIPYQLQSSKFQCSRRSFDADEKPNEEKQEPILVPEVGSEQIVITGMISSQPKTVYQPSQDLLYLLSRRLRASETSRLRQPCRKSQRSAESRTSKMRLAESQEKLISNRTDSASSTPRHRSIFKSSKRTSTLVPKLRTSAKVVKSYPTFDKLNEICSCDSDTYKKTIIALRGSKVKDTPDLIQTTASAPIKVKRSSSIRRSLSRILRRKNSDLTTTTPPVPEPSPKESSRQLEKRRSFVKKLFSPFSSNRRTEEQQIRISNDPIIRPAPISRSNSLKTSMEPWSLRTPGAPKLRRRAHSVRLKFVSLGNDAF